MEFYLAKVDTVSDSTKSGKFGAILQNKDGGAITIDYASPYFTSHEGGIFAVPPRGSEIIVAYDPINKNYIYIGTLVGKSLLNEGVDAKTKDDPVKERLGYTSDNMPAMMSFTNPAGAGLKIFNHLDDKEKILVKSVVLKTALGNTLELSDTPTRDQVSLKNSNGEGITITGQKSSLKAESSIDVNVQRNVKIHSSVGGVEISVQDGQDLRLQNKSTGMNALPPLIPGGNVDIISDNKDINIFAPSIFPNPKNPLATEAGRILITTAQGTLQLKAGTDGITIYSFGDIRLKSVAGDINLDAVNINMNATNSIKLNSIGALTMGSNARVRVEGPMFSLGTVASNINFVTSEGEVIWAPDSAVATPTVPGPLALLIPEIGWIGN